MSIEIIFCIPILILLQTQTSTSEVLKVFEKIKSLNNPSLISSPDTSIEKAFVKSLNSKPEFNKCSFFFISSSSGNENLLSQLSLLSHRESPAKSLVLNSELNNNNYYNFKDSIAHTSEEPYIKQWWSHNLKKHSSFCTLVIFIFDYISDEVLSYVNLRIAHRFFPATRRNEDFYIFMASEAIPVSPSNVYENSAAEKIVKLEYAYSILVFKLLKMERLVMKRLCMLCERSEIIFNNKDLNFANPAELQEYSFPKERHFFGRQLRIALMTRVPSRIETRRIASTTSEVKYDFDRGLYKFLLREFEKRMNFTMDVFPSTGGGSTGNLLEDGSWTGVMGDVITGKADIGFSAGGNWLRFQYVDTNSGIMEFMFLSFATGKQPAEYSWMAIFLPFSFLVWCICVISFIGAFIIILALNQTTPRSLSDDSQIKTYLKKMDAMEFVVSAFFEKSSKIQGNFSVRNFAGFWSLVGLVMSTLYKGKIVGLLAFPNYPTAPRNFDELAASDYSWGLQFYGGLAYDLFRLSSNPTLKYLASKMELEPNATRCYERARNSKFSCITYGAMADYSIQKNFSNKFGKSDVSVAPSREFITSVAPAVKKRSYLIRIFDWMISKTVDSGLIDRWVLMDYELMRQEKLKASLNGKGNVFVELQHDQDHSILTLKNLKGAFVILVVGGAWSLILFLFENMRKAFTIDAGNENGNNPKCWERGTHFPKMHLQRTVIIIHLRKDNSQVGKSFNSKEVLYI
ncbi:unnamed protein product [Allacma fusca]|uniref:Ionotropic glutamate receptor C-terminal domain-containing protein n=1 Tax=Allacma fusca TaxID=39272 RepID=A0A8J2PJG4_9HEXA|nr:unnamed protein product [Allacma fusca]